MSQGIHREFLQMLGFQKEELEDFLPKWIFCTQYFGLRDQDVEFAVHDWIPQYWDISLKGIQKCIAAYIRELVEVSRLEEYRKQGAKIIYGINPSHPVCFMANKISGGNKIQVSFPDFMMATVLEAFFHKGHMFIGEGLGLDSKCGHCSLNCTRINACKKGHVVAPDVIWSWGMFCNEAPKTDELIQCIEDTNWRYILSTLPHDVPRGVREAEDPRRVAYLAEQIRYGQKSVCEITGIPVTDEHVRQAMEMYLSYIKKVNCLEHLVAMADPQPITANELTIFEALNHSAFALGFQYMDEAIDIMIEEVQQRIADGVGKLPKGSPKLGCHFTPFCIPWVNGVFLDNGINLSVGSYFASGVDQPFCIKDGDIYQAIARQWLSNPSAVNVENEVELICENIKDYPLDGMLYGFFSFDRWLGMHQKLMVQMLEERTGIQHFYLEGDFWNDTTFKMPDRVSRIQNIAYYLKMNRLMDECGQN